MNKKSVVAEELRPNSGTVETIEPSQELDNIRKLNKQPQESSGQESLTRKFRDLEDSSVESK